MISRAKLRQTLLKSREIARQKFIILLYLTLIRNYYLFTTKHDVTILSSTSVYMYVSIRLFANESNRILFI